MKSFKIRLLGVIALSALISGGAMAQMNAAPAPAAKSGAPMFISADAMDPALTLPKPPLPGSDQGKAELEQVRQIVAHATPAQLAAAAKDDVTENVTFFADVLPGFDMTKLPATKKLFDDVRNDENFEAKLFKNHFGRLRPYEVDSTISTCVKSEPTAPGKTPSSYPSGHATMGYSMAVVLAHLIPEKSDIIFTRARLYADERVICGVHFPSDTAASQVVGTVTAYKLFENPAFKAEFDAAHAELVSAGLAH